jgi:hypothetical protein
VAARPVDPLRLGTGDAGEILTLQRAAYVPEAQAHGDLWLPPLTQTLQELRGELADPRVTGWGIRDQGRLVASVREHSHANLRLYQRLGYRETGRAPAGGYHLVHLAKTRG